MPKYALRYAPLFILALLLIPVNIYLTAGRIQPYSASAPSYYQFSSPFRPGTALYSVAQLSSSDAWAVGGSFALQCEAQDKTRCLAVPVSGSILHYSDNAWVVAGNAQEPLLSVSLDSSHDGWAVGYLGTLVHYDGNNWSTVSGPAHFNQSLFGVAMLSPSDGWAVGNSGSILHYNGKQWTSIASPTQFDLRSIAMPSPQEGWAVGVNGTILHYHNGTWQDNSSPIKNTLNNVAMLSIAEGWAVGEQGSILHYRAEDGSWKQVSSNPKLDQSTNLYGVAMSSVRSGWIIGEQQFLTYTSEAWTVPDTLPTTSVKAPDINFYTLNLYSVTLAPTGEGWAVGSTGNNNGGSGIIVILHYQGGTWSVSLNAS